MTAANPGATVIDLSANPDYLSPAVNHLVAAVKNARAANRKIILALGEEHATVMNVAMASFVRAGLQCAGIANPVMALEHTHNLLERRLPDFFPGETALQERSRHALTALKTADPAHYHRIQALAVAGWDWPCAPATRVCNMSAWLASGADIRLIDMAMTIDPLLDTTAFIDEHAGTTAGEKMRIHATDPEGVRLRNQWMAARLRDILKQADVVILQTGSDHLGGDNWDGQPYKYSLHPAFARAANDNIRFIAVFSEQRNMRFLSNVPPAGRKAMNNLDTVILRGGNAARHRQPFLGSFAEEITALNAFARAARLPKTAPCIENENDYNRLLQENKKTLRNELEAAIA
ncbi:MAG: hypothetical protein HY370_01850 [Proteobacteria bacterium]|nr:hypothetical protein [Pseudomonadota bacterium]